MRGPCEGRGTPARPAAGQEGRGEADWEGRRCARASVGACVLRAPRVSRLLFPHTHAAYPPWVPHALACLCWPLFWPRPSAGVLAALAVDPVSWKQCEDMGLSNGRGRTSPDINAADQLASGTRLALALTGAVMVLSAAVLR